MQLSFHFFGDVDPENGLVSHSPMAFKLICHLQVDLISREGRVLSLGLESMGCLLSPELLINHCQLLLGQTRRHLGRVVEVRWLALSGASNITTAVVRYPVEKFNDEGLLLEVSHPLLERSISLFHCFTLSDKVWLVELAVVCQRVLRLLNTGVLEHHGCKVEAHLLLLLLRHVFEGAKLRLQHILGSGVDRLDVQRQ